MALNIRSYKVAILPAKDGYSTRYWSEAGNYVSSLIDHAELFTFTDAVRIRDRLRKEPGLASPHLVQVI